MAGRVRRWSWMVNVVAILLGSWLLAGTADAIIANRLGAGGTAAEAKRPVRMGGSGSHTARNLDHYLGPIKQRNVFLHGEPIPDEEVVITDTGIPEGPAGACTLPVQVLASVVAENKPHLSLVTLLDNSLSPASIAVVQVGERIVNESAELIAVREEWNDPTLTAVSIAEFRRDSGQTEVCRSDAGEAPSPSRSGMPPTSVAALPTGEGIRRIDDSRFEIAQAEIDAVMNGGLATMAQDVRIVPYFEGGVSKGFKLYSIKPGSLLSKIGLMNGDVISKVNGYDISSPEKALQVYGLLKNEKNVSVDLTRNGQNKSLSYSIR